MAAARRIKPTLPAAIPYGSLTPRQRCHLSTRKQPGLALFHWTFQRGHSAHAAIPDLYRSASCSVMKVAAKEEVREQHDQRQVIRQPGLRSTESMHGRTIVRLTESLAVLSSRRRHPFEEQWAIKDFQVSRKAEELRLERGQLARDRQQVGMTFRSRLADWATNARTAADLFKPAPVHDRQTPTFRASRPIYQQDHAKVNLDPVQRCCQAL